MALTPEQIRELKAKKRTRGQYEDLLGELIASDEAGVDVAEQWPVELGEKNASTMYQGFRNAAKKAFGDDWEKVLDIMQRDDHVFILVKSQVSIVLGENGNQAATESDNADAEVELV